MSIKREWNLTLPYVVEVLSYKINQYGSREFSHPFSDRFSTLEQACLEFSQQMDVYFESDVITLWCCNVVLAKDNGLLSY